ncbi:MAG TPA: methyltransferase domain-containing protein [Fluviicola sp.]|nr:methyltransferase domain-containing protein [Fluviicola sp.]
MMHLEDSQNEWFASWFDSPYYHLLYGNRNEQEAINFLQRLMTHLNPNSNSSSLDLACGAGRHVRALAPYFAKVSGCDLSSNSIAEATKNAPSNAAFFVHDMREELPENYDYIFNLFTSFGYFDSKDTNLKVLKNIHQALNPKGELIIDFMNAEKVKQNLVLQEQIEKGNICFHIKRWIENGQIKKNIQFTDKNTNYEYTETVQALNVEDFKSLLSESHFEIIQIFGSYNLETFDQRYSDRLILHCKKQ